MSAAILLQKRRRERRLAGDAVAAWNLEDTAFATDATGNAHSLSKTGAPTTNGAGKHGFGASVSVGNYLTTPDASDLRPRAESFTITGWVNQPTVGAGGIMSKGAFGTMEFALLSTAGKKLSLLCYNSVGAATPVTSTPSMVDATWHFFAAWFDASLNRIFVSLDDAAADSAAFTGPCFSGTDTLKIGYEDDGGLSITGKIDTVAFWRRVLTPRERKALFKSSRGNLFPFRFSR